MRKLIIFSSCILTFSVLAKQPTNDEIMKYLDTKSEGEVRQISINVLAKDICSSKPGISHIPQYNYCECAAKSMTDEFYGYEIRDFLMPESHRRYVTTEQYKYKAAQGLANVPSKCMHTLTK
mgnify:FL=1